MTPDEAVRTLANIREHSRLRKRRSGQKPLPVAINVRFALCERADGTELCCIRSGRMFYEFEYREPRDEWRRLRVNTFSQFYALIQLERMHRADAAIWATYCADSWSSPLPNDSFRAQYR